MTVTIGRRELLAAVGGAAAWPLAARAQAQRLRRIGVLTGDAEDDPEVRARFAAFQQGLESLGWSVGGNIRIDYRFAANNLDRYQPLAKELVRLRPICCWHMRRRSP
jgi:putative ABC transport system substrate-binding protein